MGHQCRGKCPKLHLHVTECVRLESWRDVQHSLKTTELTCEWPSPHSIVLTSGDWRCDTSHGTLISEEDCVILSEICGFTINFANSPACACLGSTGPKPKYGWFDDVGISAFHSCVVDIWQSLSEWHLLLSACVLVCRREKVEAWNRATNEY